MNKYKFMNNIVCANRAYSELSDSIESKIKEIFVSGTPNIVKADIIREICCQKGKKTLVIMSDELQALKFSKDLSDMGLNTCMYYYKDFNFINASGQSREYEFNRIKALNKILNNDFDVALTSIDAALQYTIPPESLNEQSFTLNVNDEISLKALSQRLLSLGYEMFSLVESAGQFSVRGGIVDIFSVAHERPVRLELWGDTIDTISFFDTDTQRRSDSVNSVKIIPCCEVISTDNKTLSQKIQRIIEKTDDENARKLMQKEQGFIDDNVSICLDKYISLIYENSCTLFDYFKEKDFLFFELEPAKVSEKTDSFLEQASIDSMLMLKEGILCNELTKYYEDAGFYKQFKKSRSVIYMDTFQRSIDYRNSSKNIVFSSFAVNPWNGSLKDLYKALNETNNENYTVVILAGLEKFAKNLTSTLNEEGYDAHYISNTDSLLSDRINVTTGNLSSGILYPECKFKLITFVDIPLGKRNKKKSKKMEMIASLADLKEGDLVVHISHGIGIFCGIHKIKSQGVEKDYIKIQYAKKDILYIPVTQLDMVSKYIGSSEDSNVKLSLLSSAEWEKKKYRIRKAVKDIAKELIKLYAKRMQTRGFAFSEDGVFQRDFEASFEFEETDDQLRCISEIKEDMQRNVPMDRLLCGDVGFGKTEVALRAVFKCVNDEKQCALLVPTTILAWQHYNTVSRRFEKFPFRIEMLSNFKTPKEKENIIRDLENGKIDIVIGTHSLLNDKISFKDLGLVVIDEEQRFGVSQKEKLKNKKNNIDVLTLSATPIPRTLNMAMSGLRDMSSIEEAPQDRYPVQTYVIEYDLQIILNAIKRELRRGGQVYYLHNRTESIEHVAMILQNNLPDHNVVFAHGRMNERELSAIWKNMTECKIDVLVCTTIIETGIDIPNVNTIIVNDADRMGLSQLHQLRGRVGRSSKRAYAYFTFAKNKILSDISEKRLNAIQEFTQFGSGFKIAMRDLEIRGAGNVLGAEQHGNMESIGYDLYVKILNEAIQNEKGEPAKSDYDTECSVDIPVSAFIPEYYIKDINQRLDIYKQISMIRTDNDCTEVIDELIDRFGEPPSCVVNLTNIALIRSMAQSCNISEVKYKTDSVILCQKEMNMQFIAQLMKKMGKKVMVNASKNPYVAIKADKKADILKMLKNVLTMC